MEDRTDRPLTCVVEWPGASECLGGNHSRADEGLELTDPSPIAKQLQGDDTLIIQRAHKRKAITELPNGRQLKPARLPLSVHRHVESQPSSMPSRRFLSVWSLYSKCYEVDFGGGYLWVASGKGSSLGLFLVQKEEKFDATQSSMVLENSQGQYFVKCCDIFQTGSSIDLVFEFMNMSLTQIIGAPRLPTEQEVLAIVGQVGAPMGSLTSYLLSKLVEGLKAMRDSDVMQGQLHASRILINLGGKLKIR